ncbi:MAG TPA: dihydrodipicolinate synthase family protein [Blastocatellia bacterium]|nr:dihydrodipicolinate synthase family protein [Blastocatellia bacterium]HMV81506.1 dihydrodipicolinate synthase family protein [Blastocatellia bacterium]HMX25328.1 dihydrodipicolinate synthase family protein [Blastocatellia bacterium]HMY70920.1 dihydrodipicolinate synthase family protein [Blastocatellia bacterium]HNG28563.1 dihydrodipicolinate synthase family protein [Blastocatellia bacterium]
MTMKWQGVMPAVTTCFKEDLSIDHEFVAKHVSWLVDNGCTGIVTPGSLGEGNTLTFEERSSLWATIVGAVGDRVPVVAAISALSTAEAVEQSKTAANRGCQGLMVLPPYVYKGDWREMKAHVAACFQATKLSCMLYNNPIAYGTDFLPEQIQELANEFENFQSVKESSTDTRRVTGIKALVGNRLDILTGVDDGIVEAIPVGAVGWVAGLVNALPKESVDLFNYVRQGEMEKAIKLYNWFLPLLRLDTVPKFVQLIKLTQEVVGMGSARVRPPRLELIGAELEQTTALIQQALANRPAL